MQGYKKFKNNAYQMIRGDGSITVLPQSMLEELASLPTSIASPQAALDHDLLGSYTGTKLILENRLHHTIVQRKLTPRIHVLFPTLEMELQKVFHTHFPEAECWTAIQPYHALASVAARLSAAALVGPKLCQNPEWENYISIHYTENLFQTIVLLRLFPSWMRPFLAPILPSYWRGRDRLRAAKKLLRRDIERLIQETQSHDWDPNSQSNSYVLAWLVESAQGAERDPALLAHVEVLLALASVHTTLLRMVNVLYDLAAQPGLVKEIRAEIQDVKGATWNELSYSRLWKLDSVLRESQRCSPPTTLGMKRRFEKSHTFSNGLHFAKGDYVCLPTFAIENDPRQTFKPEVFDGLRSYKLRTSDPSQNSKHLFSSTDPQKLNFGYGRAACPGRFFASLVIKMVIVKVLTEYDFKFMEGKGRPSNVTIHEFLFPKPWDKLLIKRLDNTASQ